MNLKLREATASDISILKYWDTKQHVIDSGGAEDNVDWEKEVSRETNWQEILIAEADNRPVGVITIIDPTLEETHYWGEAEPNLRALDIWIGDETDLGKGYGTEMMRQVLERCFSNKKVKAVIVDPLISNTKAIRFYEKIGFKQIEKRLFGKDECYVYKLKREEWE